MVGVVGGVVDEDEDVKLSSEPVIQGGNSVEETRKTSSDVVSKEDDELLTMALSVGKSSSVGVTEGDL